MDRGKWSQQGVPHKGWQYFDFEDLGGLDGICEMCETRRIRYVHHMKHQDYGAVLGVGSVCAENMEVDYKAAKEREKRAKSVAGRRTRWMNAKWRTSAKGDCFINRNGFNINVSSRFRGWSYLIREIKRQRSRRESGFVSKYAAKLAAFECFEQLRE